MRYNLDMVIVYSHKLRLVFAVGVTQRLHGDIQNEHLKQGCNRYFRELLQHIRDTRSSEHNFHQQISTFMPQQRTITCEMKRPTCSLLPCKTNCIMLFIRILLQRLSTIVWTMKSPVCWHDELQRQLYMLRSPRTTCRR